MGEVGIFKLGTVVELGDFLNGGVGRAGARFGVRNNGFSLLLEIFFEQGGLGVLAGGVLAFDDD